MISVLFAAGSERWATWHGPLQDAFERAGLRVDLTTDPGVDPDYILYAPSDEPIDFSRYPNAKAVLSLWAGIERIVQDKTLTQPLARMVEPGLQQGMVEWVCGHVLRHHLGLDDLITRKGTEWRQIAPPLASDRPVTVLGLGELGLAAAQALAGLGFPVTGWSRRPRDAGPVRALSGDAGLREALTGAQILVLLLPLTPATENLINADRIALLAKDAVVLNPGRGALIDDQALLAALDSGALGHATLDVFRTEPLPSAHPFWLHPKVTVSPHIASETRPASAAEVIAQNIARGERGDPFLHLVDRQAGY